MTLAAALTAECHSRYESEVLSLDSLPAEEAREGALKIVRRLAYAGFQLDYSNEEMSERFEHLRRLAFPEKRNKYADLFEARAEMKNERETEGGKR